jgi:hypothetical protein
MRVAGSFVVVLLSACATSLPTAPLAPKDLDQEKSFVGPNARSAYLRQCFDGGACYRRAPEACPSGYLIFESIDDASGSVIDGGGLVNASRGIAFACKQ